MKIRARVCVFAAICCAILLPASHAVNSSKVYPTITADGNGPTPPPPPPPHQGITTAQSPDAFIADGNGPTPPPPPPPHQGITTEATPEVTVL